MLRNDDGAPRTANSPQRACMSAGRAELAWQTGQSACAVWFACFAVASPADATARAAVRAAAGPACCGGGWPLFPSVTAARGQWLLGAREVAACGGVACPLCCRTRAHACIRLAPWRSDVRVRLAWMLLSERKYVRRVLRGAGVVGVVCALANKLECVLTWVAYGGWCARVHDWPLTSCITACFGRQRAEPSTVSPLWGFCGRCRRVWRACACVCCARLSLCVRPACCFRHRQLLMLGVCCSLHCAHARRLGPAIVMPACLIR